MPNLAVYQVDAFATRAFAGNPAAVLLVDDWLPDAVMQGVAEENNVAITAFVRPAGAGWALRWFTPTSEASFCGHGTLATAHVLATERGVEGGFAFETRAGILRVARHSAGYALDLPVLPADALAECPSLLSEVVKDMPVVAVSRSSRIWLVELANEQAVRDFAPDFARIAALAPLSFVVTARGEAYDFVSRHFAPSHGVPEDSVTGSTHATLVPYWSEKLGKDELTAFQCSRRGGALSCERLPDGVRIVGSAVTYLKGTISLPVT
ncbi:PhzF family phenazine biosynthesis protein [Rhizobium sp. TRM95111]|uniref:PhzF family phenazine biosynthesis protein n=1 Tax=Rhizobium alarense TaxID=2846851 RepID=UPI001F220EEC|nr:PhzF family phenazine biosynthesis protein [Rhizobium alarense]MCF3641938.1 PhzF family phenazine biosynthesis protein [Rhizobium alarense]